MVDVYSETCDVTPTQDKASENSDGENVENEVELAENTELDEEQKCCNSLYLASFLWH